MTPDQKTDHPVNSLKFPGIYSVQKMGLADEWNVRVRGRAVENVRFLLILTDFFIWVTHCSLFGF